MKLFTYWWGVHLVSDNEEEVEILTTLYGLLKNPSEKAIYEEGEVSLTSHKSDRQHGDFSYKIEDEDVVLEIER